MAVREVVLWLWTRLVCGGQRIGREEGGWTFCREKVVFVGEGHFLRTQTVRREIVNLVGTSISAEDASGVGHALDEVQAGRFWQGNGQVCRDERIWDDGGSDNRGKE